MSTAAIVRRCNGSKALILGERCDGSSQTAQTALLVIIGADVVTVLPSTIRARKSACLRGKNHSYRQGEMGSERCRRSPNLAQIAKLPELLQRRY